MQTFLTNYAKYYFCFKTIYLYSGIAQDDLHIVKQ